MPTVPELDCVMLMQLTVGVLGHPGDAVLPGLHPLGCAQLCHLRTASQVSAQDLRLPARHRILPRSRL